MEKPDSLAYAAERQQKKCNAVALDPISQCLRYTVMPLSRELHEIETAPKSRLVYAINQGRYSLAGKNILLYIDLRL